MPLTLTPPPDDAPPDRVVVLAPVTALPPDALRAPFFTSAVAAGFPSPADDYSEGELDLRDLYGASSPSVFFCRAEGWSMRDEGIHDGDVLVVDRAIHPATGMIVVAAVDGELTVKRYVRRGRRTTLLAANPEHPPIELREGQELLVWGVVTHSFRFHLPHAKRLRVVAA